MPYRIGEKGTNGCSGFPVVDDKGKVAGCHPTRTKAGAQVRALYASEAVKMNLVIDETLIEKSMCKEGDFVIVSCEDEIHVGIVQYVMTDGTLGIITSEYALEASMEDPAMLVRTLEFDEEDGWEETEYLVGTLHSMATMIQPLQLEAKEEMQSESDMQMASYASKAVDVSNRILDNTEKDDGSAIGSSGGAIASIPSGESSGGNYPVITTHAQVGSAINHWHSSGKHPTLKEHIINRAREIGAEHLLPADWYPMASKRDRSMATRERMASEGQAMPDGSFPIANGTDLRNAIQSVGRSSDYAAAKKHIITRARALGMTDTLPESWKNSVKKTDWAGSIFDLNGIVKNGY